MAAPMTRCVVAFPFFKKLCSSGRCCLERSKYRAFSSVGGDGETSGKGSADRMKSRRLGDAAEQDIKKSLRPRRVEFLERLSQISHAITIEKSETKENKRVGDKEEKYPPKRTETVDAQRQKVKDKWQEARSYAPEETPKKRLVLNRLKEANPANHSEKDIGMIYSVPPAETERWLKNVFHPDYYKTATAFNDTYMMVREPGLEIIKYMKMADYNLPVIRYLLFGRNGTGKSQTLGYVMHYCGLQNWMVVHHRWPALWTRYPVELQRSTFNSDRFDTPNEGAAWLSSFKSMNGDLIKSLELKCENRYVWSKRETTEVGDSWLEAIDFGIGRPNYSCDVVGLILKELKISARQGKLKALIAIDGANGLFGSTPQKTENRKAFIPASDFSLTHHFKKVTRNNWTNGAILVAIDKNAGNLSLTDSHLPAYLLQEDGGFEHFDPHIPIHVQEYSDKEANSCLDYYIDNQWIQNPAGHTEAGKKEMIFLSCKNPLALYETTRAW